MRTKFMSALVAVAAALSLASGTAFAANEHSPDATGGYLYPNFWTEPSVQQPQSDDTAALQQHDGSISIYITQHGAGTHLFPPNPYS
jgi:hypothetical protein